MKVEGLEEIASYGVAFTPALVIDGVVKASDRIPRTSQVEAWLRECTASDEPLG